MSALPEYEIYAIKYAQRQARRADHFIHAPLGFKEVVLQCMLAVKRPQIVN